MFLGRLEDVAGMAEVQAKAGSLEAIIAVLPQALQAELSHDRIKLARNGTLVSSIGLVLHDGDELAFLPPVSGG